MVIRLAILMALIFGAARAQDARLEIILDERNAVPVAGEMILATIKGTYTLTILRESLPIPETGDFEWVQLDRDLWERRREDGRAVLVMQRRLALFPKRSGALTFGPLTHELAISGAEGDGARSVTADAIAIDVAPYPGAERGSLSAAALTLTDELSANPGELADGETLFRKVTVEALGALPQMIPPRPPMRTPWLVTFTEPEEREVMITPDGPIARVVWRWSFHAKTGEPGVLPAVPLHWFDAEAREMRTTEIPAIPFGYASFRANIDKGPPGTQWNVLLAATGGLFAGLLFLSRGYGIGGVRGPLERWTSARLTRKAKRAAAREDWEGLKEAMEAERGLSVPRSPEFRALVASYERRLFARPHE